MHCTEEEATCYALHASWYMHCTKEAFCRTAGRKNSGMGSSLALVGIILCNAFFGPVKRNLKYMIGIIGATFGVLYVWNAPTGSCSIKGSVWMWLGGALGQYFCIRYL